MFSLDHSTSVPIRLIKPLICVFVYCRKRSRRRSSEGSGGALSPRRLSRTTSVATAEVQRAMSDKEPTKEDDGTLIEEETMATGTVITPLSC